MLIPGKLYRVIANTALSYPATKHAGSSIWSCDHKIVGERPPIRVKKGSIMLCVDQFIAPHYYRQPGDILGAFVYNGDIVLVYENEIKEILLHTFS